MTQAEVEVAIRVRTNSHPAGGIVQTNVWGCAVWTAEGGWPALASGLLLILLGHKLCVTELGLKLYL